MKNSRNLDFVIAPGYFIPVDNANSDQILTGCFAAEYESANVSVEEVLTNFVTRCPKDGVFYSSGSLYDNYICMRVLREKEVEVKSLNESDFDYNEVAEFISKKKIDYCLTDLNTALILFDIERQAKLGRQVILAGPFPHLEDMSWRVSQTGGASYKMFAKSQWAIAEDIKSVSIYLAAQKLQNMIFDLGAALVVPFLRDCVRSNHLAGFESAGLRYVGAGTFARSRMTEPYRDSNSIQMLSEKNKNLANLLLTRFGRMNRSVVRIENYV